MIRVLKKIGFSVKLRPISDETHRLCGQDIYIGYENRINPITKQSKINICRLTYSFKLIINRIYFNIHSVSFQSENCESLLISYYLLYFFY